MSSIRQPVASKLPNVKTTIFTIMSQLAAKHGAINLSQGFPDFKSDPKLMALVSRAMKDGFNQYAPMPGIIDLREGISAKFEALYRATYHPESEITITSGATQAIFTIVSAFIDKGDEVIIFKPAYDCYEPSIILNKGKVVPVQLMAPDYSVNWDNVRSLINPKTRMIVINTPHNPSGTIWNEEDMLALQDLVGDTDIIVLSDEVYEHIIFDNEQHQSVSLFPGLKERSFVVASFGKTFHNTGWKMGYCCAPKAFMAEFRKIHQYNVFSANHPMQSALAEYLKTPDHYLYLPKFYQAKRDLFLNLIGGSNFKFIPSKGSYFQLLDYSEISKAYDVDLAKKLTVEHKIASIPLSVFNHKGLDNKMLRFCFAKTQETLERAAEILNKL